MPAFSELPPPEESQAEGYYPDPLGGRYARWWDGSEWTAQVGPETPRGATPHRADILDSNVARVLIGVLIVGSVGLSISLDIGDPTAWGIALSVTAATLGAIALYHLLRL